MFKWFWTVFSLGAPDNTGQTLLGEWEIYRPQFSDIPKIDNLDFGGITRENRERDWDFSLARVILRSATAKTDFEKKSDWLLSFTTCMRVLRYPFSLSYAKYGAAGMTYYGSAGFPVLISQARRALCHSSR